MGNVPALALSVHVPHAISADPILVYLASPNMQAT